MLRLSAVSSLFLNKAVPCIPAAEPEEIGTLAQWLVVSEGLPSSWWPLSRVEIRMDGFGNDGLTLVS